MTINLPNLGLLSALTDDKEITLDATLLQWSELLPADNNRWKFRVQMADFSPMLLSTDPMGSDDHGFFCGAGMEFERNCQDDLSNCGKQWFFFGGKGGPKITVQYSVIVKQSMSTEKGMV